ncbi:hypothetical protein AK812_SmicGene19764 [Symbiodinium microadriaticum]|uniref:E3 ubiquitin-protein ligase HERC2 n=1 Tax=Symbiodinium microadriaticum TaxID=2951 RepID=A0A1Q9DRS0_SYMMI|nr:hypothetical protein AK812_SmicGene19764 [Symbiodinium microadriaticum]
MRRRALAGPSRRGAAQRLLQRALSVTVRRGKDDAGGSLSRDAAFNINRVKVRDVVATDSAFAAVLTDGTVQAWGEAESGGHCPWDRNDKDLQSVKKLYATSRAFAALKDDGTVIAWGDRDSGGDARHVRDRLRGVVERRPVPLNATASRSACFAKQIERLRDESPYGTRNYGTEDGGSASL